MATGLSPEDLEALAVLPSLDAQEANLRRQLEMATQLRNRQRPTYSGPAGSFFGGLANAIDERQAAGQQQGLQAQIDALLQQRASGDTAGARLKAMTAQQGLEKGALDISAGKQRMERDAADAARLRDPLSPRAQMGAELLRKMGVAVPPGASAEDIEAQMQAATRLEISRQAGLDRGLSRRMSQEAREDRIRQGLEEREVGGYDFAPGRIPSKDNAKKFTDAVTAVNGMRGDLDALEENFKAKGTESFFGADQARQSAARESILLQLKELQNLGVLNGRDYEILSRIVPDTSSPMAMLSNNTTLAAQFGEFRRQLENRLQAGAGAMGYAKKGGQTGAPTSAAGASGLTPEKQRRLEELRAKKAAGALR